MKITNILNFCKKKNRRGEFCFTPAARSLIYIPPHRAHRGPVAQLIERIVRNDEVVGLIPIRSTSLRKKR